MNTAAELVYLDRTAALYLDTKQLIADTCVLPGNDRDRADRPHIEDLTTDVAELVDLRLYGNAARLIERKVREAYDMEKTP